MLQNTPVAVLVTVCIFRVKRSLAQGIVSGRPRPRAHRCPGFEKGPGECLGNCIVLRDKYQTQ